MNIALYSLEKEFRFKASVLEQLLFEYSTFVCRQVYGNTYTWKEMKAMVTNINNEGKKMIRLLDRIETGNVVNDIVKCGEGISWFIQNYYQINRDNSHSKDYENCVNLRSAITLKASLQDQY